MTDGHGSEGRIPWRKALFLQAMLKLRSIPIAKIV